MWLIVVVLLVVLLALIISLVLLGIRALYAATFRNELLEKLEIVFENAKDVDLDLLDCVLEKMFRHEYPRLVFECVKNIRCGKHPEVACNSLIGCIHSAVEESISAKDKAAAAEQLMRRLHTRFIEIIDEIAWADR